jgi:hypothetical protein
MISIKHIKKIFVLDINDLLLVDTSKNILLLLRLLLVDIIVWILSYLVYLSSSNRLQMKIVPLKFQLKKIFWIRFDSKN